MKWFNLILRIVMETGIVMGLGYWGFHEGDTLLAKIVFCVLAVAIGFGFWGLVDFHRFGKWAEPLRCAQELLISALAAFLVYRAGAPAYGYALMTLSVVYHLLMYLNGERLLKRKPLPEKTG